MSLGVVRIQPRPVYPARRRFGASPPEPSPASLPVSSPASPASQTRPSRLPLVSNLFFWVGSVAFTTNHFLDIFQHRQPLLSLLSLATLCFTTGSTLFTTQALLDYVKGHRTPSDPPP